MFRKEFKFRKNHKKTFILFTMLFLIIVSVVLSCFSIVKEEQLDKKRKQYVDEFSVFLNLQFENIDKVVTLAYTNDWCSDLASMNKSEILKVSPIDKRKYYKRINQYNAILGLNLQLTVYFANSGYAINASMFWRPDEELFEMDEALNKIILLFESSKDEGYKDYYFFVEQDSFYYARRIGDAVFICLINNSLISEESYFLKKDEGILVNVGDKILYQRGKTSRSTIHQQSIRNLQISTTYFYRFHFSDYALIFFSIIIGALLLYFIIYIVVEKFLFRYYIKIKKLNDFYGLSLNTKEKSLFFYLTETVDAIIQKEHELSEIINLNEIKGIYYKMALNNFSNTQSESVKFLKYLKIDQETCFRILVSVNMTIDVPNLIKIKEGVYLCEEQDIQHLPGTGWGIGNTYRKVEDIAKSYYEATIASHYAVMYGLDCACYSEIVFTKEKYEAETSKKINGLHYVGDESILDEVRELFAKLRKETDFAVVLAEIENLYEVLRIVSSENHLELEKDFTWVTLDDAERYAVSQIKLILEVLNKKLKRRDVLFEKVKEYTEQNLFDCSLSLQHIASYFGCSVSLISRLFSEIEGKKYNEYINERRVERAAQILETNSADDLSKIADQCGFYSVTTFRRVFKKYKKVAPGMYRELHKK